MKKTMFMSSLFLGLVAAASAQAVQTECPMVRVCQSPSLLSATRASGQGFQVEFRQADDGSTTAVIEEVTISKERKLRTHRSLGELPCKDLSGPRAPDDTRPVAICQDPAVVDNGYVLEVLGADFAGVQRAKLYEERFAGRTPGVTLNCKLKP